MALVARHKSGNLAAISFIQISSQRIISPAWVNSNWPTEMVLSQLNPSLSALRRARLRNL